MRQNKLLINNCLHNTKEIRSSITKTIYRPSISFKNFGAGLLNLGQSKTIKPIYNICTSIVQIIQEAHTALTFLSTVSIVSDLKKDKLFGTPNLICLPPKILC